MSSLTIAKLIDQYFAAFPAMQGDQFATLRRIKKEKLGARNVLKLTAKDFIDHFQARTADGISAATNSHDVTYLKGMLDYAEDGMGIAGVSSVPLLKALPVLRRHRLIGSSKRRNQMPSTDQSAAILEHMRKRADQHLNAEVIEYQDKAGRRISESCRHEWGHLDAAKKIILVKNMKHPRMKEGHDVWCALPDDALAILLRQKRMTNDPRERIFKANEDTVGGAYRRARRALGFHDLQLRDIRRGTNSRLLREKGLVKTQLAIGHMTREMSLVTYNGNPAEDFHR